MTMSVAMATRNEGERLPFYCCGRVEERPRIDGDLSKPFWQGVEEVALRSVDSGADPAQPTTVRLRHDGERLYLAFHVVDRDIWGTYREHDEPLHEEEVVEVFLDPSGRGKVYYELEVSPHGVTFDALVVNRMAGPDAPRNMKTVTQWDCRGLEAAVCVDGELDSRKPVSSHWDVEIAVPLATLSPGHALASGDRWRMNLYRIDRSAEGDEYQAWSPTGRVDFHVPARFGVLELA